VEYLPTEQMWINVNTKLKQGLSFSKDHTKVMNCPIDIPNETLDGPNMTTDMATLNLRSSVLNMDLIQFHQTRLPSS